MLESQLATPAPANPSTILVVDDNPTNIQVIFSLLGSAGYQVAIAKSGEAALKRLEHSHPDLILLDVMMPDGIDGFETCRRLKAAEATQGIPVIFMTALADTVDKVKGLELGAVDYLTKPLKHVEVLARIKLHLKLHHLNQTLEQRVAERTTELNAALEHLKNTQVQLVHTEKMSSLGQLVAGIAHEINNPINFIHGNLKPAREYSHDLLQLVDLFCQENPQPSVAIAEHIDAMDLEFVREDLPELLQSMTVGTERIRELVLSLRNFSRLDESETKTVDLHEGLESTLLILHNRFKTQAMGSTVQIEKYYGELPLVSCYPSQLNQVFLNLLGNSLDALEDRKSSARAAETPTIWLKTRIQGSEHVQISIADNGSGIPETIQAKIFDAFFTTKPVGKGTGLGLSISHQIIVNKHCGQLWFHSTPGQGTEFVIELPIRPA
ncbi:MAG: response regulator [Spirulina sp. SIO3F2]|nr:response regulator [Spirulina sp. SIO3F2]